jgi:hypothetical protein
MGLEGSRFGGWQFCWLAAAKAAPLQAVRARPNASWLLDSDSWLLFLAALELLSYRPHIGRRK